MFSAVEIGSARSVQAQVGRIARTGAGSEGRWTGPVEGLGTVGGLGTVEWLEAVEGRGTIEGRGTGGCRGGVHRR